MLVCRERRMGDIVLVARGGVQFGRECTATASLRADVHPFLELWAPECHFGRLSQCSFNSNALTRCTSTACARAFAPLSRTDSSTPLAKRLFSFPLPFSNRQLTLFQCYSHVHTTSAGAPVHLACTID